MPGRLPVMQRLGATLAGLFALAAAVPAAPAPADDSREAHEAAAELDALRGRIDRIKRQLSEDRAARSRLQQRLQETDRAVADAARRLRELERKIDAHTARLAELRKEQKRRRARLEDDREALARQLRAAYLTGRQGRLKMLLNQEDPSAVGRLLVYYDYLTEARGDAIRRLTARLRELEEIERRVARQTRELEELRTRQSETVARLKASRERRAELLDEIERSIRAKGRELERMRADEKRLEDLVSSLQQALSDIPAQLGPGKSFGALRGQLRPPARGRLAARYGAPRRNGRLHWQGVLIRAERGSDVHAVYRGRVAFADWLPGFGLVLILEHGDGYLSLYGHNEALYKEVGQWVDAGEVIASVGSSGGRRAPALYFEIRKGRETLDPMKWVRLATASR